MLGYVDVVTRSFIAGWAADPANPAAQVEMTVRVNGKPCGRIRANLQRDGLRNRFPGATGLYGFRYEFEWPLSMFVTHNVEVVVARSGQTLPNGQQVIPAVGSSPVVMESWPDSSMSPILVTSTGRAGSSLCMARLAAHPKIVVGGDHPHEVLMVSYYALALRTLVSEADRTRSMNPDGMLGLGHRFGIGFNPFNESIVRAPPVLADYWNNRLPERLAAGFAALIRDYYGATQTLAGKSQACFFAEKANPVQMVSRGARMMFGAVREIALVRDPRDLVCSYRSFFKATTESAIPLIKSQLLEMARLRETNPSDMLFVRYEDLILQQETTMSAIWRFLELETPQARTAASEQAQFLQHGTSASAVQSIGRWRDELTASEIEQCQERFAGVLQSFGYEA